MSGVSGTASFEPRARIIKLLGEELITNEIVAIFELVKNGYDACASTVIVNLENIDNIEEGTITIRDNGTGMSLDTILNSWLQPGTEFRRQERAEHTKNRNCDRPILGEKGVGRFAAQKLGSMINVTTKTKNEKIETNVEVDWTLFDDDNLLSDVKVKYWQSKPEAFKENESGTIIQIKWLLKKWTARMLKALVQQLNILNSPVKTKDTFDVEIYSNVFSEVLTTPPTLTELAEKAVYSFDAEIDENGFIDAKYEVYNPAFPQFEREKYFMEKLIESDPKNFPEGRKPTCGPFKLKFYSWDLDAATLRETVSRQYYGNYIRPYTGIKVYRDSFRVWPYGEPNDDWLSMDSRRVNQPTRRFSRNQIIGIVDISLQNNPNLRDKTDREGFIDTAESDDLKRLIIIALTLMENERRLDKDKVDALRERKKPEDEVYTAINELRTKTVKQKHFSLYMDEIDAIEKKYDKRVRDITNNLLVSAGIGIAYMLPAHDISDNATRLENRIKDVLSNMNYGMIEYRENLQYALETITLIKEITRGIRQIGRKTSFTNTKLSSIINSSLLMIKYKLKAEDIEYIEPNIIEDSTIRCKRNLIIVAILNIVDNAAYWVKANKKENWKIRIIVDKDENDRPRILISDKGPGIKDPPEAIVQPFFSRKPDGSGLGLHIVQQIMDIHEGQLDFLFENDEENLWPGANVALIFKHTKEKEQ